MVLTVAPLSYRSVTIVDPITGNQATVVGGALTTTSGGGGGGSVTQGTVPWVVSGGGTAGTAATGVVTVQGIASMTKLLVTPDAVALPAGSAVVGKVGIDQTTPGTTNAVQIVPGTGGGLSVSRNIVPNNVTAIVVKSGAGQLYAIAAFNNSSTIAYIKVYNATSATAGSGTPFDGPFMIPAPAAGGGGIIWSVPAGVAYSTGITYCVTTGIADNDTAVPAASAYTVLCYYK